MVNELGFNQDDVKWALKITDTGEGIDVDAAEQLLKQQKRKHERNPFAPRGKDSLLRSVMKRQGSQDSGWRFA
jgi:light-regulated signal transduction histidine kinase (bacteriophytochrome)